MTLHPIPSEFPYIWGKLYLLFHQYRLASGRQWHRWEITHRHHRYQRKNPHRCQYSEFYVMSVEAMDNLLAPISTEEVALPMKDYFTSTNEAREATLTALQNILCKIIIYKKALIYCIAYSYMSANFRKSSFLAKYGLNLLIKTLTSRELSL
jgi:hypothetical protein